ncbi:HlyD family secretion protein [Mesoterricola silvestris]|uniref:Secretion protein HlyD n=1 Tax=Mesoterricola silvestris TaxID=2927979 RepID=A0AA48GMB3_9BACT|nr:efflux RND transporter periplasmic adaptor subunit [Mesoterricola silvestris]BDU73929.1 secretion protein HlyD [Mesoterricola silvestris]
MNPRYRIFALLGALLLVALGYFYATTDHSPDLALLGTVDANQVVVSAQILGRIEKLAVTEGQDVKAGDLIAILDPGELAAAKGASAAQYGALRATAESTRGDTEQTVASAQATRSAAAAALAEATANRENQEKLTGRTVALAGQGILSAQDRDTAEQTLKAVQARERAARDQAAAAEAALRAAQARTRQAVAAEENAASARAQDALAGARLGYTRILAPVSGKVGIWAARQGEVVNAGAPIVTIVDLGQTWVYAAVAETEADAVQLGDVLKVRMPGGALVQGTVLLKAAEGDFATQRDVSRRKRDIKTVRIKLLIPNPGERYVPGMTAEVLVPKARLVRR